MSVLAADQPHVDVRVAGRDDGCHGEDAGPRGHGADGSAWLARMSETAGAAPDHGVVDGAPSTPPPLTATAAAPRLSPAEEARTLVAATNVAGLATVTADGDPWASLVTYGPLDDGSPVLCLSHLAEHGRNLAADPVRASWSPSPTPARSARGRARHARRPCRTRRRSRDVRRGAHRPPRRRPGRRHLRGLLGLLALGAARRARALGRRLRPHGLRLGNGLRDGGARSGGNQRRLRDRPPQRGPRRRAARHRPGAGRISRRHSGAMLRASIAAASTSPCTRPAASAPTRVAFPQALTDSAQLRAATVELTHRARAATGPA